MHGLLHYSLTYFCAITLATRYILVASDKANHNCENNLYSVSPSSMVDWYWNTTLQLLQQSHCDYCHDTILGWNQIWTAAACRAQHNYTASCVPLETTYKSIPLYWYESVGFKTFSSISWYIPIYSTPYYTALMVGLGNISILSPPCNIRACNISITNIFTFQ